MIRTCAERGIPPSDPSVRANQYGCVCPGSLFRLDAQSQKGVTRSVALNVEQITTSRI